MNSEHNHTGTNQPTNIQDAQAMKRMGMPLNTPVKHKEFDRAVSKHWLKIVKAENGLDHALAKFIKGQPRVPCGKLQRRNDALYKAAANAGEFANHFDKDPAQQFILGELAERALVVVEWWREAFATAEAGTEFSFTLDDVPRVFPLND